MKTLQEQINWLSRVQWLLGIGTLLIGLAFYLVGYRPMTSRLAAKQTEIANKQHVLDANQSRAQTLPIVQMKVDHLREQVERFDQKLPKNEDLGPFIENIAHLRENSALRKWECTPGAIKQQDLFLERPITMKFEGDFLGVYTFLTQAELMPRMTRVRNISIRSKDKHASRGQVEVEMAMSIYFSEG